MTIYKVTFENVAIMKGDVDPTAFSMSDLEARDLTETALSDNSLPEGVVGVAGVDTIFDERVTPGALGPEDDTFPFVSVHLLIEADGLEEAMATLPPVHLLNRLCDQVSDRLILQKDWEFWGAEELRSSPVP